MQEDKKGPVRLSADSVAHMLQDGGLKLVKLPDAQLDETTRNLIASEKTAWNKFSGKDIEVPPPPQQLLDTLEKAKSLGITVLEPHYLPAISFSKVDMYPEWGVQLDRSYWVGREPKHINETATLLTGNWVIIDSTPKPVIEEQGQQVYVDNFLKDLLTKIWNEGTIEQRERIPRGSRFDISWNELHEQVLPRIAILLGLQSDLVRLPRAIEFNVIGNMHRPSWGVTDTWEWFEDLGDEPDKHLIGGSSTSGGLANINSHKSHDGAMNIGFRPIIVFPS